MNLRYSNPLNEYKTLPAQPTSDGWLEQTDLFDVPASYSGTGVPNRPFEATLRIDGRFARDDKNRIAYRLFPSTLDSWLKQGLVRHTPAGPVISGRFTFRKRATAVGVVLEQTPHTAA